MTVGFPKPSKSKKSVKKHPDRDEFELEELSMALEEAKESGNTYSFAVFNHEDPIVGKVTKMDANTKLITIERYMDQHKVHFLDVLKVNTYEG